MNWLHFEFKKSGQGYSRMFWWGHTIWLFTVYDHLVWIRKLPITWFG